MVRQNAPAMPVPPNAREQGRLTVQWRRLQARALAARDALQAGIPPATLPAEERRVVNGILGANTLAALNEFLRQNADATAVIMNGTPARFLAAQNKYLTAIEEYADANARFQEAVQQPAVQLPTTHAPKFYDDKYDEDDMKAVGGTVGDDGDLQCGAMPTTRDIPCRQPLGPDLQCYYHP